jgi:hypothetical protein
MLVKQKTYRGAGYNPYAEYLAPKLRKTRVTQESHCVLYTAKFVPARVQTQGNKLPKQAPEQILLGLCNVERKTES